jgi:hypothetical protein
MAAQRLSRLQKRIMELLMAEHHLPHPFSPCSLLRAADAYRFHTEPCSAALVVPL